jgi:hypothetical protein
MKKRKIEFIAKSSVVVATLSICLLGTHEANNAKPVFYPHGFVPTTTEWEDNLAKFQLGSNGNMYYGSWRQSPLMVPSASIENPAIIDITREKPLQNDASLFLCIDKTTATPVQVTLSANGQPQATITLEPEAHAQETFHTRLPISKKPDSDRLDLQIMNEQGSWFGGALFVPNANMTKFIAFAIYPAFVIGLLCVVGMFSEKPQIMLTLTAVFGFLFYYYLNYPAKIIPYGSFFSDSKELIDAIRFNVWSYDMRKHVLFLPVTRVLCAFASFLTSKPLKMFAIAFSFIAAVNLLLAAASIRLAKMRRWSKPLLCAVYASSFAVATYSSIYESYIFSALIVNLNILASMVLQKRPTRNKSYLAAALCGLLPLATWQLLAFVPFFLIWNSRSIHANTGTHWRPIARQLAAAVLSFCICYVVVWGIYSGPFSDDDQSQGTAAVLSQTHASYASTENMNWSSLQQVLDNTFVASIVNTGSLSASNDYHNNISIAALLAKSAASISILLMIAIAGAYFWKFKKTNFTILCYIAGFLVYLGFHWYFNPAEMILYTPPIILLWLLPVSIGVSRYTYNNKYLLASLLSTLLLLETAVFSLGMIIELKPLTEESSSRVAPCNIGK